MILYRICDALPLYTYSIEVLITKVIMFYLFQNNTNFVSYYLFKIVHRISDKKVRNNYNNAPLKS